ncbi:class I SAM-dependent methyltransferase [Rhodobacter sp. SY28-1]|uniref:class I SAM-dependent methyltransferase n=1 Tax=Rhodobacter sp. SY28-1 TaxID=2562317 RepID=UPI0010C13A88|nr:class I SAM-dependent methyltransferase [Rhodobacter sp. SY28-1]
MLQRHADWFSLLNVEPALRDRSREVLERTLEISQGMMHRIDVESLAAAVLHCRPSRVFEIGTYRGASSEMILQLLPDAQVISIAFVNDQAGRQFNNDELSIAEVGALVSPGNRDRFTQLIGDSHKIDPKAFVRDHGRMDLVFIDGDHSREGVRQDTELARAILAPGGAIAWHDANPKKRYIGSRLFLEQDLPELALATTDDFIGGIALWTEALERKLQDGVLAKAG